MRTALIERNTKETKIKVEINLDGHRQFRTGYKGKPRCRLDLRSGADLHQNLSKFLHVQFPKCYLQRWLARKQIRHRTLDRNQLHLTSR